jgi:cytochrome b-561
MKTHERAQPPNLHESRRHGERGSWFDVRLDWSAFRQKYLRKVFPVHSSFFLGEIALFSFILLVVTGIFLSFMYEPSAEPVKLDGQEVPAAYASVVRLDRLAIGSLVRGIHHWSAHLMITAVLLHLLRILLTGAYRRPRELNWVIGIFLLGLSIFAAFSGYLLPYDEFAVTATGIGYGIARSIPWVGPYTADLLFAGHFPSPGTIPRFHALHVIVFPLFLAGLIGLHLLIMIKQKHTQPVYARAHGEDQILGVPLWPHQTVMMAILFLLLTSGVILLSGFLPVHPVEYYGPPVPGTPDLKPDWYFLWVYGLLKLIPGWIDVQFAGATINSENMGGVILPGLLIVLLLLVPFWKQATGAQHYLQTPGEIPLRTALVLAVLMLLVVLSIAGYKDDLGLSVASLQLSAVLAPLMLGFFTYVLLKILRRQ